MKNNIILILLILLSEIVIAQNNSVSTEPNKYTYKVSESDTLKAYVFYPPGHTENLNQPAIAIFHGGGWAMGDASWGFRLAKKYAGLGMASISVQYRLSDKKNITPIDAMEDAKDFFIWVRENANDLNLIKDSIAAFGWSAGGHLVTSAAVFEKYNSDSSISSKPNALILQSPAVSILNDGWFKQLLLDQGNPIDYSPAQHLKEDMPPTIIVIGRDDTVTPAKYSEFFHNKMIKYGNKSELHIYDGVGHLFTPSHLSDKGRPQPDQEVSKKAFHEIELFLTELGYLK